MDSNEELMRRIGDLEREVASLRSVNLMPVQVQKTLEGRGFLGFSEAAVIDPLEWDSLNRVIPIVDGEDIQVLEWPFRWLRLRNDIAGDDLYVPVYGKNNL